MSDPAEFIPEEWDERLVALTDLIGRTGAKDLQIRYCDEEQPVIWAAVATYESAREIGAGFDPLHAVFRLTEALVDGGECNHCHKMTGIVIDIDAVPARKFVCWYQWDPEKKTIRRGCEGD